MTAALSPGMLAFGASLGKRALAEVEVDVHWLPAHDSPLLIPRPIVPPPVRWSRADGIYGDVWVVGGPIDLVKANSLVEVTSKAGRSKEVWIERTANWTYGWDGWEYVYGYLDSDGCMACTRAKRAHQMPHHLLYFGCYECGRTADVR